MMADWFPQAKSKPLSFRSAVIGLPDKLDTPPLRGQVPAYIPRLKPGQSIGDIAGKYFGWVKVDYDKPAPTLPKSTTYAGFCQLFHPVEIRCLAIEELKRIMGYPDCFRMAGTFKDKVSCIGNSVAPLFMRAIARNIKSMLQTGQPLRQVGALTKVTDYPAYLEAAWVEHLVPRQPDAPTVISLFAGCGGSSLGYSMAGYRELLAVEWDDNAVATFELNFPDVPVYHGDICKLDVDECLRLAGLTGPRQLDVLDGSPPCFLANCTILTNRGKIPIESCTAEMRVITHTGKFGKVNHVMQHIHHGQLYTIETKYGRKPITCTPEHPFFVRRRYGVLNASRNRIKQYGDPEWLAAEDLRIGDVLCEPHISDLAPLEIPKVVTKQRINLTGQSGCDESAMRLLERECQIKWQTLEVAWLLGFYLAEGHTRGCNPTLEQDKACRREVIFSVSDHEAVDVVQRVVLAGFHPILQKHGQGACRITISDLDLWTLVQTVGHYADGKFVPVAFMVMPVEWQEALLDGYMAGDGCTVQSKRVQSAKRKATTVSLDLALDIARIIAKVHRVVATIEVLYPAGVSKIQGRNVDVKEAYSVGYALTSASGRVRPGFVDDFGAWLPIKKIAIHDEDSVNVYNLEVEEDHSYTAEGFAVHNCQGFSTAGKRDMGDDRNQLFREFVRLLRGLQPKVFVMENVSGLVKGVMKLIFVDMLQELKTSDYQVSARLLNAMYFNVPQSRERLIFIGVRNDLGLAPSHPKAESSPICALCATGGVIDQVKNPAKWRSFGIATRKLEHHKPSPTLDANALVPGSAAAFDLSGVRIGAERYAVIGSYPNAFVFAGTWKDKLVRIGNSVPPLFMRSIAQHVRQTILEKGTAYAQTQT